MKQVKKPQNPLFLPRLSHFSKINTPQISTRLEFLEFWKSHFDYFVSVCASFLVAVMEERVFISLYSATFHQDDFLSLSMVTTNPYESLSQLIFKCVLILYKFLFFKYLPYSAE